MMPGSLLFWWLRQLALILVSICFFLFGIQLLISAYQLQDPFVFVLTFFSSNFIILISAALLVGFMFRAISLRNAKEERTCPRKDRETVMAVKKINKEELSRRLGERDLIIVDVRANWSESLTKIPGAVHGAAEAVSDWASRFDPERPVVVYGASPNDADSREAAEGLEAAGFSDVAVLAGGWPVWQAAEMPIEKRAKDPLPKGVVPGVGKP
jgi:rhodanese-related sulfurtransferase